MPQGPPTAAAASILETLADWGVLVVPVGELERFEPSVAGHGPVWVNEVLASGRHLHPSQDAAEFARRIEAIARKNSGLGS